MHHLQAGLTRGTQFRCGHRGPLAGISHDAAVRRATRRRRVWQEPLLAESKDWHGLRRFRLRELEKVNSEALLIAAGQNLKQLLSNRVWGRRPFPGGTAGIIIPTTPWRFTPAP